MPKIVSEEERRLTKEAIYKRTVHLIKEKGIRSVSVDDITTAVGIGKGSFYAYYPSKEICLFEVIKQCERESFSQMEEIMKLDYSDKAKAVCLLKTIFTAEDSLVTSINQTDVEVLLRKLPPEYREREQDKSENNFQNALKLMNLSLQEMEVVALLTDCLSFAASNKLYSQHGTVEALDIMINAIADFITKKDRGWGEKMNTIDWIRCPVCGNKTRGRIRQDTELKNFPLYCPKCKQESLIEIKDLHITVIKEPDAKTQSR